MMKKSCQQGFGLVELMVALVIGLIIVLGAGQLFLTGFQSFRQVEMLGDKQVAVTFVSDVLMREIRSGEFDKDRYELQESQDGESCTLYDSIENQPIVDGFSDESGCSGKLDVDVDVDGVEGFYRIYLPLEGEASPIEFHVMNRTEAVDGSSF